MSLNKMIYQSHRVGDMTLRAAYEVSDAELKEGDKCTFKDSCTHEGDSAMRYDLAEVSAGTVQFTKEDIDHPEQLPYAIQELIREHRERIVTMCTNCLVEFLMQSSEDTLS